MEGMLTPAQAFELQKRFYATGVTLPVAFRKARLRDLLDAMKRWEGRICEALWTDLHKSGEEAYLTETSIVVSEIKDAIRNIGLSPEQLFINSTLLSPTQFVGWSYAGSCEI